MFRIAPGQDLDLSFLNEIADGSNEFIVESIDMFLEHTPEMLQAIAAAIADKDWALVYQTSHKLKPNLGFFGMPVSQALIQEVEIMGKEGAPNPDALIAKFIEVRDIVEANIVTLKLIKEDFQ